ncbi:MipA/OmpV family protein [bacterium]|jgi:MipA family protein|nr:MipA/OmpV family protein [bacterium]
MNKFIVFLLIVLISSTFETYSKGSDDVKPKTSIYAGGGFISKPTYDGSSSRRFMWIPMFGLTYEDKSKMILNEFNFYGPYANLSLYDSQKFDVGIFGEYDFGRQNGDDNSLVGLEEIDPHFQVGLDLEYSLPYRLSLGYSIVTDTKDFYSGSYDSEFSLNHKIIEWVNFDQPLINKTSISFNYANGDYLNEWYGTPYPAFNDPNAMYKFYKPESGIYKASLSNNVVFPLSENITGLLNIGYNRLMGDAGNSQLVKRQGSKNQFSLMFNAMYKFYSF